MDLPCICDHQVGYFAGGYSLSPRWFLTWYIYPFFSGLAALMSADIFTKPMITGLQLSQELLNISFIPTFDFFVFLNWLLSALNSICLPPFVCSLYDNGSPLYLRRVYVSQLPIGVTIQETGEVFKYYGHIVDIKPILKQYHGRDLNSGDRVVVYDQIFANTILCFSERLESVCKLQRSNTHL